MEGTDDRRLREAYQAACSARSIGKATFICRRRDSAEEPKSNESPRGRTAACSRRIEPPPKVTSNLPFQNNRRSREFDRVPPAFEEWPPKCSWPREACRSIRRAVDRTWHRVMKRARRQIRLMGQASEGVGQSPRTFSARTSAVTNNSCGL